MTSMRSTTAETIRITLSDVQAAYARLQRTQTELTSGKQIQQPEDDPFGTGRALGLRTQGDEVGQLIRNIQDAKGLLQQTDGALSNTTQLLQRARELTVQAANGTLDQTQRDAIAQELTQIRDGVREQMNAQFAGKYLFAGSATLTQPYPAAGGYAGNDDVLKRLIGQGNVQVDLNVRGWEAFSVPPVSASAPGGGETVLTALDGIVADIKAGVQPTISADIDVVDKHLDQVNDARAKIGSRTNRLDTTLAQLEDAQVNVKSLLSQTEDVDIAKAMVDYSSQQATYQAALQTTAKVIQPTLLDFLH